MSRRKVIIILLTFGLMRKMSLYKMSQYILKLYECFSENVKIELNLSSYVTKADLKKQQVLIDLI